MVQKKGTNTSGREKTSPPEAFRKADSLEIVAFICSNLESFGPETVQEIDKAVDRLTASLASANDGFDALMYAVSLERKPCINEDSAVAGIDCFMERMVRNGVCLNGRDKDGKTLLMKACESLNFSNKPRIFHRCIDLISRGVFVDVKDEKDDGLLHYAVRSLSPELFQMFLSHGAKIHPNKYLESPFHVFPSLRDSGGTYNRAIYLQKNSSFADSEPQTKYLEILSILSHMACMCNIDLNSKDGFGRTFLNVVMQRTNETDNRFRENNRYLAEYLRSRGARAGFSRTMLDDAVKKFDDFSVKYILEDNPGCIDGKYDVVGSFSPGSGDINLDKGRRILKMLFAHGATVSPADISNNRRVLEECFWRHDIVCLDELLSRYPDMYMDCSEIFLEIAFETPIGAGTVLPLILKKIEKKLYDQGMPEKIATECASIFARGNVPEKYRQLLGKLCETVKTIDVVRHATVSPCDFEDQIEMSM